MKVKVKMWNVSPIHWDWRYWGMTETEKDQWRKDNNVYLVDTEIDELDINKDLFEVKPFTVTLNDLQKVIEEALLS